MVQITLMEAYLIEILRKNNISDEEILQNTYERKLEQYEDLHETFNFTNLYPLAEELENILTNGYQIKFLTKPGLVNLLRMKYGKISGEDFIEKDTSIEQLTLTEKEQEDLANWLANNWKMVEDNNDVSIVPAFD